MKAYRNLLYGLILATVLIFSGCPNPALDDVDDPDISGDGVLESISLNTASISLEAGATRTLTATANYDDGSAEELDAADVTWSSDASATASVSDGVVTANAVGSTVITASYDEVVATVDVTVTAAGSSSNLITNGDFSSDVSADWNLWSHDDGTSVSVANGEVELVIASVGTDWWGVQFDQQNISVSSEGTYTLSFDARSVIARDLRVEIVPAEVAASPTQLDFMLSTDMTSYEATVDFTGLGTSPVIKLNFGLGNVSASSAATTVYLDNISLAPQESAIATSQLTVNVTDGTNPLEGASVNLNPGMSATTDASGVASFDLESRQYPLNVTMSGYIGEYSVVDFTGDATVDIQLSIAAPTEDSYLYGTTEAIDVTNTLAHWDSGSSFDAAYADSVYDPSIEVTTAASLWGGEPGFAVAFTGYQAGSAAGYDNLVFKFKTTEVISVSVKFPGAGTQEEIAFTLADYSIDLGNGWIEVSVPLAGFGDLGANSEVGLLTFQSGLTESAVYITDIYFDIE